MRIYTDHCTRQTFVDRGLGGWQPLGAVINATAVPSMVNQVLDRMAEARVVNEAQEVAQPFPSAPGIYPGLNVQGTYIPASSKASICNALWAANQDAMAAIQAAVAFHGGNDVARGIDLVTRALDSVIQGGQFTVDYFPSKAMVAAFVRSTQAGGPNLPPRIPASLYATCASPVG